MKAPCELRLVLLYRVVAVNQYESLPFLRCGLSQRRAANRRPIDRVHGWREPRFDLFDGLPFPE